MAKAKHPEELITRAHVITKSQADWLDRRRQETGVSVSYFVRAALDHYRDHPAAKLLHERAEAREEVTA